MPTKAKTWAQLLDDIKEIERKWGPLITIENDLDARGRRRAYHSPQEREVRLRMKWGPPGRLLAGQREIKVDVRAGETATENLRLIAVALEMVRLAEVRDVHKILAVLYRQMYPAEAKPPPATPPPGEPRRIPPHYAILHLDPAAPLEVAEAAYRALARKAHPDAGGTTEQMQRLNAAIERIREERR